MNDSDPTTEIWKPILGYEGLYEVSNLGKVRSLNWKNKKGVVHELTYKLTRNYFSVGLTKQGKQKWHKVHRLVATAFIDNPENKPQVNHKDCNKLNNCVSNLEWCTASENMRHAENNGLMEAAHAAIVKACRKKGWPGVKASVESARKTGWSHMKDISKKGAAAAKKARSKPVAAFNINGELEHTFESATEAEKNGFSSQAISACCLGKRKTHKGFIWCFIETLGIPTMTPAEKEKLLMQWSKKTEKKSSAA